MILKLTNQGMNLFMFSKSPEWIRLPISTVIRQQSQPSVLNQSIYKIKGILHVILIEGLTIDQRYLFQKSRNKIFF